MSEQSHSAIRRIAECTKRRGRAKYLKKYLVKKINKKGFYEKEDEPTVAGRYKMPMIPFWHDPCVKIALQLHLLLALYWETLNAHTVSHLFAHYSTLLTRVTRMLTLRRLSVSSSHWCAQLTSQKMKPKKTLVSDCWQITRAVTSHHETVTEQWAQHGNYWETACYDKRDDKQSGFYSSLKCTELYGSRELQGGKE